ncbi:hypothetical protein J4480_00725 [Candidatus Woesearchaeota archaeon]|nr:hypothetical protein [Candidatus Woesearchaeota archaeon]
MEFRKVNITLPVQLFEKSKQLVEKGFYSNFSDLVRSTLRKELKGEQQLASKEDEWQRLVKEIRADLQNTELAKMSKEQIIKRLRKTREKVYDEEYG